MKFDPYREGRKYNKYTAIISSIGMQHRMYFLYLQQLDRWRNGCYVEARGKLVANLKTTVTTLTTEIEELRKAVPEQAPLSSNVATDSWSTVVKRGRRQNVIKRDNDSDHHGSANSSGPRTRVGANPTLIGSKRNDGESVQSQKGYFSSHSRLKVGVEGKRKIWGTLRATTASLAVLS